MSNMESYGKRDPEGYLIVAYKSLQRMFPGTESIDGIKNDREFVVYHKVIEAMGAMMNEQHTTTLRKDDRGRSYAQYESTQRNAHKELVHDQTLLVTDRGDKYICQLQDRGTRKVMEIAFDPKKKTVDVSYRKMRDYETRQKVEDASLAEIIENSAVYKSAQRRIKSVVNVVRSFVRELLPD